MKKAMILLFCMVALPGAALAQAAEESTGLVTTKWSLKQPRKKMGARPSGTQAKQVAAAGPAVPKADRVFVPKRRPFKPSNKPAFKSKPNATPIIKAMTRADRR